MLVGYTTLMCPEATKLSYLETLLSWAQVCDKIAICYSTFPKLDLTVPEGAVCPWEDDGAIEILKKFDKDLLGDKLVLYNHKWDPNFPREDGKTKQLARELANSQGDHSWLAQFDADEVLREKDAPKILEFLDSQKEQETAAFATAGILEMFGDINKVRFGFGNWLKIRLTRATNDIMHDMPLWARARNPRTGQIVAQDNKDDGAGMVFRFDLNRPNYNTGTWLFNPQSIMMGNAFTQGQVTAEQVVTGIQEAYDTGVFMFHTSWIDIARKWSMGWFFDNFWSVLNGKQDTFTEKAEEQGYFTHTRIPANLEEEIKREMERPGIVEITGNEYPIYFKAVREWRQKNGYDNI